jgi:hypothetical protein
MDPYLERNWRDVHTQIVTYASAALNGSLPSDLISRVEERVVIDRIDYSRIRAIYPDVRVYEDPAGAYSSGTAAARIAVAEPIILEPEKDEHTEAYITILDPEGGELVTVVEFLSPTNKNPTAKAFREYCHKRNDLEDAKVNLVEIDLVRNGDWLRLISPLVVPERGVTEYRAIVRREHPQHRVELYPISLRSRLPVIPIPLRDKDKDVTLDLQPLIEQAYRNGRYDHTDYTRDCDPPLEWEDARWAGELLVKAGKRRAG